MSESSELCAYVPHFQASEAQQLKRQSGPAEPNKATDGVYVQCT